ncbi:MAG: hypothetical protein H6624_04545 [Bdellovibrionaceae bacterium]|nr:hypothetical protein [Bdellovibrionales bacterium]MCB9083586.1 hypothetical protein [Pseudobdellovibrionaceae bacterium]
MEFGKYLKAVLLVLLVAVMGNALGEPLNIKKERVKLDFNSMIEDVNKESASIAESLSDDITSEIPGEAEEVPAKALEGDQARVKEFLDVEMGLGDASAVVDSGEWKARPSTPITNREDIIFEENMERHDTELEEKPRGPSNVAQKGTLKSSKRRKLAPN